MFKDITKNYPFSCFMVIFMSNCPQFWGSKAIYMFESHDQALGVFAFYGNFVSYCPYFWGSSAIWNDHKTRYMFEGLTKNSSFLRFMAVFHELLPIVLGFQGDLKWLEDPIQVWGLIKNSSFSCFMAVFMSYCPHFWGSRGIRMARKTLYMFESYDQKLVVFAFYGCFHELLPIVLGFQGDL